MFKFYDSLMIFVVACICSVVDTRTGYLALFSTSFGFSVVAWLIMMFCFRLLTPEQVTILRKVKAIQAAGTL